MVSEEAKSLIKRMLVVSTKDRITADQALRDPWFRKFTKNIRVGSEEDKLDSSILERLRDYRGVSTLKKAAMNLLVKMADFKEIEQLRDLFMRLDKD
jgi:calcium-dependent protein kinase